MLKYGDIDGTEENRLAAPKPGETSQGIYPYSREDDIIVQYNERHILYVTPQLRLQYFFISRLHPIIDHLGESKSIFAFKNINSRTRVVWLMLAGAYTGVFRYDVHASSSRPIRSHVLFEWCCVWINTLICTIRRPVVIFATARRNSTF